MLLFVTQNSNNHFSMLITQHIDFVHVNILNIYFLQIQKQYYLFIHKHLAILNLNYQNLYVNH